MEYQTFYAVTETQGGWLGFLGSDRGLLRSTLPCESADSAITSLGTFFSKAIESPSFFKTLIGEFKAYFNGKSSDFSTKLDLTCSTPFDRAVWETTRTIPYGETRSYGWVARQLGKPLAPRAVGNALGRNVFPIIVPCHRVIGSDGQLGGFGGGLNLKRYLLELEKLSLQER